MSFMEEVRRLARAGRPQEGIALVERAADEGDGEALFMLANWRLWGMYGVRNLEQGHVLLAKAAAAGVTEAARLQAILTANGTGCPSEPERARDMLSAIAEHDGDAARQLAMLDAMPLPEAVARLPVQALSSDPEIRLVRGLLTEAECRYLVEKSAPALRPSLIFDPQTGQGRPNPIRSSSGRYFDPSMEDLVVHAINRRIAAATGSAVECGEMLNVLHYTPGQQYRSHVDALTGVPNQRHLTALVYLNDGYGGGETRFDELGILVKGKTGDCLIFRNAGEDGRPDLRTMHAGLPVTAGTKWLASRWIRQGPHDSWTQQ